MIINARTRKGSLRQAASGINVATIFYEAGEALRFDEMAIKAGVRAPASGIWHMEKPLGSRINKNTRIGFIADPFGSRKIEVLSHVFGMVIGRLENLECT